MPKNEIDKIDSEDGVIGFADIGEADGEFEEEALDLDDDPRPLDSHFSYLACF